MLLYHCNKKSKFAQKRDREGDTFFDALASEVIKKKIIDFEKKMIMFVSTIVLFE